MEEHVQHTTTLDQGISLYIHIPFCKTKCPYCDFNTYQGIESLIDPYIEAFTREVQSWGKALDHPRLNTIFLGGGTPSYLPTGHIAKILSTVGSSFEVATGAECTLEANPGDLRQVALGQLLEVGVNRLSIGVQSLDDSLLSMLGRRHTAAEVEDGYKMAVNAGFQSINMDLIYGLPHQTMAQWEHTLDRMLEMLPPHLSLYCLTLEGGTPMESWVNQGSLPEPDPDLAADMYIIAEKVLGSAGYHHYEISNWAMDGFECAHNLVYWQNGPYLGVGPGAHSSLHGYRFWDVLSPRIYIEQANRWASQVSGPVGILDGSILSGIPVVGDVESIDTRLEMAETMFLGLRLLDGFSIDSFKNRFNQDPSELYGPQFKELVEQGLLNHSDGTFSLTNKGCLLANQVFIRFLD